ncbi:Aegerolysin aa-Pri1 [Lenzites betulinus]|nr:Aegerolysin aa-Pri1 [Lenzites betulinus]
MASACPRVEDVAIVEVEEHRTTDFEGDPRAYAQWVSMEITNNGYMPLKVKNVYTSWGKLYINGNKDNEVKPSYFENKIINPTESLTIAGCGRANASSGTEGGFSLVDPNRNDEVARKFYWDCPWGSKRNTWEASERSPVWEVYDKGANIDSGALGNITITAVYKP